MGSSLSPKHSKGYGAPSDGARLARLGFWFRWGLVLVCLLNICYRLSVLEPSGCGATHAQARQLLGRAALPGGYASDDAAEPAGALPDAGGGDPEAALLSDGESPQLPDLSSRCTVKVEDVSSWASAGLAQPPFAFPRIIHQTVEDKGNVSCESLSCMQTWMEMNPGYEHRLVDAKERREFVATYYPEIIKVYDSLGTNVERADLWRYVALHRYGGVYADSDVKCLKPIDEWNAVNGHDADLLVGVVFTDKRDMVTRVNNFILAATPCHPIMAAMPFTVMSRITATALAGGSVRHEKGKGLMAGVVGRTGPVALTATIADYAARHAAPWPVSGAAGLPEDRGNLVGRVRLMPRNVMTMGWETAEAKISCEEAHKLHPNAYICHQYFGTWKSDYKHRPALTYTSKCTYAALAGQFAAAGAGPQQQ